MSDYIAQPSESLPNRGGNDINHLIEIITGDDIFTLRDEVNLFLSRLPIFAGTPIIKNIEYCCTTGQGGPVQLPAQIINVVASGKDPDGGDYLGFGSEIQGNTARYVMPFDWQIDEATIGRTDTDNSNVQLRINGSVVETLFTTDRVTTYDNLGLSGNSGDYLEVRVQPNSNKINNPVVALLAKTVATIPPIGNIPPYSALIHYIVVE